MVEMGNLWTKERKKERVEDPFEEACQVIAKAKRIAFFTGAGISVDSGIPDFRYDAKKWMCLERASATDTGVFGNTYSLHIVLVLMSFSFSFLQNLQKISWWALVKVQPSLVLRLRHLFRKAGVVLVHGESTLRGYP